MAYGDDGEPPLAICDDGEPPLAVCDGYIGLVISNVAKYMLCENISIFLFYKH